jgi:hypothetical protein
MQNRTAIILPLGMLLEKVDISEFSAKLHKKAKEENSEFVFTSELQRQTLLLSRLFYEGKIASNIFEAHTLQLLGIKTMQSSEFWSGWNSSLILGNVIEKVQLLQNVAYQHNALVYLFSDIDLVHIEKIAIAKESKNITLDTTTQPMLFSQFPLYATCQFGKNPKELIKYMVNDIRSKEFNKPDALTLILRNPEIIQDTFQKAIAKRECDAIAAWCKANGVTVKWHNHSLAETLTQIFAPESTATNTLKVAFS